MVGNPNLHQAQVPRLREVSSTAVCPCCVLFSGRRYIAISSRASGFLTATSVHRGSCHTLAVRLGRTHRGEPGAPVRCPWMGSGDARRPTSQPRHLRTAGRRLGARGGGSTPPSLDTKRSPSASQHSRRGAPFGEHRPRGGVSDARCNDEADASSGRAGRSCCGPGARRHRPDGQHRAGERLRGRSVRRPLPDRRREDPAHPVTHHSVDAPVRRLPR